jgi:5-methylcytosine-specific restriction endonuclease McrA
MTRRRAITEKMKIASLLYHNDIECALCGQWLTSVDPIEWDHYRPLAMDGAHDETNIMAVHAKCHLQKTFGAKATTAGSDMHKIAKDKRFAKGKMAVNKGGKKKTAWSKRVGAWAKGRKLQSKGFVKI